VIKKISRTSATFIKHSSLVSQSVYLDQNTGPLAGDTGTGRGRKVPQVHRVKKVVSEWVVYESQAIFHLLSPVHPPSWSPWSQTGERAEPSIQTPKAGRDRPISCCWWRPIGKWRREEVKGEGWYAGYVIVRGQKSNDRCRMHECDWAIWVITQQRWGQGSNVGILE